MNQNAFHIHYVKKRAMALFTVLFGLYKGAYYHVTTEEEIPGLVKYFNVKHENIFLCPNITASPKISERKINKNVGEIKLVFISRIHSIKNLLTGIKAVNLLEGTIQFDIYGPLEDKDYWNECEMEIKASPNNVHIRYCGSLQPSEVSETFMRYHCFLSPSISENYGHAVAEALSVLCPVILLRGATPWDEVHRKAGFVSEENSATAFSLCIKTILDMDQQQYDNLIIDTENFIKEKSEKDNATILHKSMIKEICSQ